MMYRIYYPFVLGMSKIESDGYIEDEGSPIDLNLSPSLTVKENFGAQVVDMIMKISFPSMFW